MFRISPAVILILHDSVFAIIGHLYLDLCISLYRFVLPSRCRFLSPPFPSRYLCLSGSIPFYRTAHTERLRFSTISPSVLQESASSRYLLLLLFQARSCTSYGAFHRGRHSFLANSMYSDPFALLLYTQPNPFRPGRDWFLPDIHHPHSSSHAAGCFAQSIAASSRIVSQSDRSYDYPFHPRPRVAALILSRGAGIDSIR